MNREVEKGRALEEPEAEQVIASLIKQRRDSIEQFTKASPSSGARGGGDHLLETYLPPPVDQAAMEAAVDAAVAETGASGAKDLGRVMKGVMSSWPGAVDGSRQPARPAETWRVMLIEAKPFSPSFV